MAWWIKFKKIAAGITHKIGDNDRHNEPKIMIMLEKNVDAIKIART